jgi:hypothetical protein
MWLEQVLAPLVLAPGVDIRILFKCRCNVAICVDKWQQAVTILFGTLGSVQSGEPFYCISLK